MYNNLIYFHKHKEFNVVVLQNDRDRHREDLSLKKNISCYYYKELQIFNNRFVHFLDFNPFYITKIIKILKKYKIDLIHVDYPYGINILRFLTNIPISYCAYGVEALYWKYVGSSYYKIPSWLKKFYSFYIYFLEKYAIKVSKIILAYSKEDEKNFFRIYKIPSKKVHTVKSGYNKEIYDHPIKKSLAREKLKIEKRNFIVIFHGSYYINVANIEAINIIRKKIAPNIDNNNIIFLIAGRMPNFRNQKNLKFIGFVKDLNCFLYAADLAIVPIFRGSGVRLKMIDYLSARIPMVTTKKAVEGLILKNDVHTLIIEGKNIEKEIIEKIIEVKTNPNKLRKFKENIETLLKVHYDWDIILKTLEKKYKEVILNNY